MSNDNHDNNGSQWRFRVDKNNFTVDSPSITGREILIMAGKTPVEQYLLILSGHGQPKEISLDEKIDLSQPGIERFRTLERECREGFQGRKDFQLPSEDTEFLEASGLQWETTTEGRVMRVVIYNYPVPDGYNVSEVDMYLRIDTSYPDTQIDMFYVYPALSLVSGHTIKALATESFDGRIWQRWSRHRANQNVWRPGVDCIETHLALVNQCLTREVK
ncbi:multiubiquitin domain-containing protein [Kangiella koreensis]|uniref:Multi-ubiquitin domain-containing protein n=1 Tax=Kangiella koreensis (strain DSM 16069 / JCM 12317 / KCTC 12182 / SW-125) TaxID=523791 RepID=C7R645_KANKD|nr:multiubiquitin domain-containing protein [Kangiella koreensis]ACV25476.1 conserved hypothetical protein [Kangiella koreensis DSM 16069]